MGSKRWAICLGMVLALSLFPLEAGGFQTQQSAPTPVPEHARPQNDPLADLSLENRALFDAMRDAVQTGRDADVVADGKKLLASIPPKTQLADFVTQMTAGSALETGDAVFALTLIKPLADAHPDDWHAAALLARAYAESGDKALRNERIVRMIALHKQTSDPNFAKMHIFPIQKVKLHSGYAVILYPFEPLKPYNVYLLALVYTNEGKQVYRIEIESDDVDQSFFKPKHPGERRFSIDTIRDSGDDGKSSMSQALHGFIDGVFDYDTMRDKTVDVADDQKKSHP